MNQIEGISGYIELIEMSHELGEVPKCTISLIDAYGDFNTALSAHNGRWKLIRVNENETEQENVRLRTENELPDDIARIVDDRIFGIATEDTSQGELIQVATSGTYMEDNKPKPTIILTKENVEKIIQKTKTKGM